MIDAAQASAERHNIMDRRTGATPTITADDYPVLASFYYSLVT